MVIEFGSCFAGVGGFDLGLEWAGLVSAWQIENDPFCQEVLTRQFPTAARLSDIRRVYGIQIKPVPVVVGGFPCQDISFMNTNGKGLDGERSGLWSEQLRLIRAIRDAVEIAVIENVPALTARGLDRVLWGLAKIGFDAEWQTIPASAFGLAHQRERLFIVAYPASKRRKADWFFSGFAPKPACSEPTPGKWYGAGRRIACPNLPNRIRIAPNSGVCRMVDVVPGRLDRYRGLGNAVPPVVALAFGKRIVELLS